MKSVRTREAANGNPAATINWWPGEVERRLFQRPPFSRLPSASIAPAMSDLFSAAAKPLLFAENECIEARSLRKRQPARQSTHFLTVEDAGACSSDEAKSLCTTSDEESSGRNKHRAQEQQEKPFQPRLRRNSLGKPSLVTATRFLPSSTPKSSVTTDEVIRRVVEWAIDNASTDVDLAYAACPSSSP